MNHSALPLLLPGIMALAAYVLTAQEPIPQKRPEYEAHKSAFEERVKQDIQRPHEVGLQALKETYTASLRRALETAQQAGKLDDALAVKAEIESITLGHSVPATDEPGTPAALTRLRDTYREARGRLEIERQRGLYALQLEYVKILDPFITRLTKEGLLDYAEVVRKDRDAVAAVMGPAPINIGKAAGGTPSSHTLTQARLLAGPWANRVPTDKLGAAIYTFRADKTMTSTKNGKDTKGAWSIKEDTLRIEMDANKFWSEYSLELEPIESGVAMRETNSSRGKRPDTTLTQAK